MDPILLIWVLLYLTVTTLLYYTFSWKEGQRRVGLIIFTNPQVFWICLFWPLTALLFLAVMFFVRWPRRPRPEDRNIELVDVDRAEQKVELFHPELGDFSFWYQRCRYRQWRGRWPGLIKHGWRIKGSHRLIDPQDLQFIGRISHRLNEREMLAEVISDYKRMIAAQYAIKPK